MNPILEALLQQPIAEENYMKGATPEDHETIVGFLMEFEQFRQYVKAIGRLESNLALISTLIKVKSLTGTSKDKQESELFDEALCNGMDALKLEIIKAARKWKASQTETSHSA